MAIFTIAGKDIIKINDADYLSNIPKPKDRVHLIRLKFNNPNDEMMEWVIDTHYQTNRYVIDHINLKYYNYFFKKTNLKYYIINSSSMLGGLISFYKRNNKVLLDITLLDKINKKFVLNSLEDILFNTEVIIISNIDYKSNKDVIDKWRGNCIISNTDYTI